MFEEQDFEEISSRMLSNVDDKYDKREGSIVYDATAPIALELANFYIMLDMVLDESFADTASYYFLIKRAAERGLFPNEETKAVLKMRVIPADAPITAGDRFNLDTLNYTVVKPMDDEDGAYQVECETAGTVGNQQLGLLLPLETENELNDLQSAELTEVLIPGEDEEDVESFRERYFASFDDEPFGGNQADYKKKVNEINGVGGCKIIREWENGYNPAAFIPTDVITAWYQSVVNTLSDEVRAWLTMVYDAALNKLLTVGGTVRLIIISSEHKAPSQTLIDIVQETIDPRDQTGEGIGLAPIGHVVNVVGVREISVDIALSLDYETGYSFDVLKDDIETTIDDYLSDLRIRWASSDNLVIRTSQIGARLLLSTGIVDIKSILLNGQKDNITLASDSIPVRGDVVVG